MNMKLFWYGLGSIYAFFAGSFVGHTIKFGLGSGTCWAIFAGLFMWFCVYEINKLNERARR